MTYYNEFDRQKAAWLRELMRAGEITEGKVDERSIKDIGGEDIGNHRRLHFFAGIGVWDYALLLAGWPAEWPVWTASCPCQPFSTAGRRKGTADDRHLWPTLFRLVEERRPVCLIGEQVGSSDGEAWLDLVFTDLERSDYTCGAVNWCAAGVGAPHPRQRLYWCALRLDGLADALCAGPFSSAHGSVCGREEGAGAWHGELERSGSVERVGNSTRERRGEARGDCGRPKEWTAIASQTRGFWRDADWVLTRPQRVGDAPGLRPVEPGSFPLASGAPARVGRLRGYGDAIVAPAAAAFIECVMEEILEAAR